MSTFFRPIAGAPRSRIARFVHRFVVRQRLAALAKQRLQLPDLDRHALDTVDVACARLAPSTKDGAA